MLTKDEIFAIRSTWLAVAGERDRTGELFYEELFKRAPQVRPMFSSSPKIQGRKLMETLAIVVDGLDNLDGLVPTIRDLGRFHANLGATAEHYHLVGEVLIETIARVAGPNMTPTARLGWQRAYAIVARIMLSA
ncbi:globin domain-containing protein [Mesobacterium pallidum]|uniref:globin domain-containing protein n=1 Tax=Mesobacterium pallidum TaxID=2872037 RepID=UPI001EE1BED4|nr:globin domain-containing protein [Mesobacterium pallidum]